jgi:predicted GIY-YIG superfamily endonuclease
MWYVYILKCKNGDYYKGCTNNIAERLHRHQKGLVQSTKMHLPVSLMTFMVFTNQTRAYQFEKYLKSGSGRAFINKHFV